MPGSQPHQGLPPELLTNPEWQRACLQRDFAKVFHLVKVKAGIYPSRVAALCGMTPSRVGEIMSGRRGLAHIDVIERVADGLRIPGAMLGLAHRPWEIPSPATSRDRLASLPSRSVQASETSADAERSPDAESHSDLDDLLTLADGRVTRSTLLALRSSVEDYWRRDDEHGGASLRPAVVGHLRYVTQMMRSVRAPLRRDLQSLAAELARLAGWAYFDARQYSTARTHFTQALRLSHGQDDYLFMANVLSCMSLQATYDGQPADAVALACKAQDSARAAAWAAAGDVDAPHAGSLRPRHTPRRRVLSPGHRTLPRRVRASPRPRGRGAFLGPLLRRDETDRRHGDRARQAGRVRTCRAADHRGPAAGNRRPAAWPRVPRLLAGHGPTPAGQAGRRMPQCRARPEPQRVLDSPRVAGHVNEFHQRLAPYARETPVIAFEQRMREALG